MKAEMSKLESLIENDSITIDDLLKAGTLLERAKLVRRGLTACKENLKFTADRDKLKCYEFLDTTGEYHSWAICKSNGTISFYTKWDGEHIVNELNLNDEKQIFFALGNEDIASNLKRFLMEQIQFASNT